jgi:hypothetical protein
MSEENQEETLDFLHSYAIPYVGVDMPPRAIRARSRPLLRPPST